MQFDRRGQVALIACPSGWDELSQGMRALESDSSARVVVIAAKPEAGDGTGVARALVDVHRFTKPVIAALEGTWAGDAWSLALACDVLIAAPDTEFAVSDSPSPLLVWALSKRMGRHAAARVIWRDRRLDGQQALAAGLLSELHENGRPLDGALELAQQIAGFPAASVAVSKAAMRRSATPNLEAALIGEDVGGAVNRLSEEAREARNRFMAGIGRRGGPSGKQ